MSLVHVSCSCLLLMSRVVPGLSKRCGSETWIWQGGPVPHKHLHHKHAFSAVYGEIAGIPCTSAPPARPPLVLYCCYYAPTGSLANEQTTNECGWQMVSRSVVEGAIVIRLACPRPPHITIA